MGNYLKIKKRKIIIPFLLIFNQIILSSYAFDIRKMGKIEFQENEIPSQYRREFKELITSKKQNQNNLDNQEPEELKKYVEDLEKLVEETFDANNFDNLKSQQEYNSKNDSKSHEFNKKFIKSDIQNKKIDSDDKILNELRNKIMTAIDWE